MYNLSLPFLLATSRFDDHRLEATVRPWRRSVRVVLRSEQHGPLEHLTLSFAQARGMAENRELRFLNPLTTRDSDGDEFERQVMRLPAGQKAPHCYNPHPEGRTLVVGCQYISEQRQDELLAGLAQAEAQCLAKLPKLLRPLWLRLTA